ncbi:MAG: flagellar assembly peptidoglycan hydrolase FlgJ [Acidihalobacter sp.]|uniref:flagellar assembly peptidoglycan hydrolase FlgJ n=1 Tax=Acidihalobacter sp. TaxID=1872108 RepID=UPI00307F741F
MTLPTGSATLAATYTDFQGLDSLKAAARAQTPAAKVEAAKQFEALFIQMMLKSMRDATPHDSLFGSSQERLYQGLYDHQIALNMAQGQGIGLRSMIEKALGVSGSPESSASGTSTAAVVAQRAATPDAPAAAAQGATAQTRAGSSDWPPASPQAFVETVMPYARAAAEKLGVSPEVLVAQAALETGWGKHVPAAANGASSNNLFGIKAGKDWSGSQVSVPTVEYRDGLATRERASFRAYPSIAASFSDYAKLISQHPRYQQALANAGDPAQYLAGLQQAGYATDPAYAAKIGHILGRDEFLALSAGFKNSGDASLT